MSEAAFKEYEHKIRIHGLLMGVGFLVILPLGVLTARYLRTFTNRWFWAHSLINFLVGGPLIFAGWAMADKANELSGFPIDHHKRVGYAVIGLYIAQILIGTFIHFVHVPYLYIFHRAPQNYFHAILGLVILAMAGYQVHDGIYTEWPIKPIAPSAKHAWLGLLIAFWVLYFIGLAFLPRQYRQEGEGRLLKQDKAEESS